MSPADRIRLRHLVDAADAAAEFMRGRTRTDLDSDRMLLFALVRAVEVLGEAAARVSDEGRSGLDLPWGAIVGMRNRLVHAYFDVDRDVLWATVQDSLPKLRAIVAAALEADAGE